MGLYGKLSVTSNNILMLQGICFFFKITLPSIHVLYQSSFILYFTNTLNLLMLIIISPIVRKPELLLRDQCSINKKAWCNELCVYRFYDRCMSTPLKSGSRENQEMP